MKPGGVGGRPPPRMRDGDVGLDRLRLDCRVIPTCVGRRGAPPAAPVGSSGHPHERGAETDELRRLNRASESPPLAWDRDLLPASDRRHRRGTPTGVGRGRSGSAGSPSPRSHPHVRETEPMADLEKMPGHESPPHAWGGGRVAVEPPRVFRVTPTRMGRSRRSSDQSPRSGSHPPRVWDGGRSGRRGSTQSGGTPTCVGRRRVGYELRGVWTGIPASAAALARRSS
jgi:hypothetical protein